jgi:ABC-type glycerol-3-phosphate transport system permease component
MASKMRLSLSDRLFYCIDYVLLIGAGLIVIFPLLNVFSQAVSNPRMVLAGRVLFWPRQFTLDTILRILSYKNITTGFFNTFYYAIFGTLINLVMTVMCAYPLAQPDFRGKKILTVIFTFTMFFGGGMIPTYLNIKNLGLLNTRAVMLLPGALAVWNMILARTFFQATIPREMYESAYMDGANDIKVLLKIVMPLSMPIMAVLTLFYAVGHWNSYFNAMMYLSSPSLFNIQIILRSAISNIQLLLNDTAGGMARQEEAMALAEAGKYALIVISMLPVLIIYPFVQKYFIKGIMIGALKG